MTESLTTDDVRPDPAPGRGLARTLLAPSSRRWHVDDGRAPTQGYTQGTLALTYRLPSGVDAEPRPGPLALVPSRPEPDPCGSDDRADDAAGPAVVAPDAHEWAARFVQAVVEVVSGDRALTQLARWTEPAVYDDLGRRRARVARHRRPGPGRSGRQQVATVHVWQPDADSAEVAARVTFGGRSRAIAARLDFRRGRWVCTALAFG